MLRKIICVRARNQITLPMEVISHLQVAEGDFLQVEIAASGRAQLVPARLAVVGTPEAKQQDEQAEEQIRTGQFGTFRDVDSFASSLGQAQTKDTVPTSRSLVEMERALIAATLLKTKWNRNAAAKRLGLPMSRLSEKLKKFKLTLEPTK